MSNLSNYTSLEILELANLCCPAFSLLNHRIGTEIQPTAISKDQLYWLVSIIEEGDFPTVRVELIEVLEYSDQLVKGYSRMPGSDTEVGTTLEVSLYNAWIFMAEPQRSYIPRDSALITADRLLSAAHFEGTLPTYVASCIGLLDGRDQIDEPHRSWTYGKHHRYQRCTVLDLSKGECVVTAGEYAEYGEYGRDKRRRIRHSSGGEVGQCLGFAYVDIPREVSNWAEFQAWSKQKTEVNVFSTEHSGESTDSITELDRWIQEQIHTLRDDFPEPMYDSLSNVPNAVLNPPLPVRLQRVWVMLSRNLNGLASIQPICLQSGQLHGMGGRVALFKLLSEPAESLDCTHCQQWSPQITEGVCPSCTALMGLLEALPTQLHPWVVDLSHRHQIEVEEVDAATLTTDKGWVMYKNGLVPSVKLQLPLGVLFQRYDGVGEVYHWKNTQRTVELKTYHSSIQSIGVQDENTEREISRIELQVCKE